MRLVHPGVSITSETWLQGMSGSVKLLHVRKHTVYYITVCATPIWGQKGIGKDEFRSRRRLVVYYGRKQKAEHYGVMIV